jgi:hypothetical protein
MAKRLAQRVVTWDDCCPWRESADFADPSDWSDLQANLVRHQKEEADIQRLRAHVGVKNGLGLPAPNNKYGRDAELFEGNTSQRPFIRDGPTFDVEFVENGDGGTGEMRYVLLLPPVSSTFPASILRISDVTQLFMSSFPLDLRALRTLAIY